MKKNFGWYVGAAIWRLTRRKTALHRLVHKVASIYTEAFEDRGDDPRWNGENRLLQFVARLDFRTLFDVGANVGDWTAAAMAANPGARIHAFELSPRTAASLARRFASTRDVTVNAFGLADSAREVSFLEYPDNPKLNSLLLDKNIHKLASVLSSSRVIRGDEYCKAQGIEQIDFLKIDAEGSDKAVLDGFSNMLQTGAIRLIQFEYGYAAVNTRVLMVDYVHFLAEYGYKVAELRSTGIRPDSYNIEWNNFESGPNYVAFREGDLELLRGIAGPG